MTEAEHRKVEQARAEDAIPGEIHIDPAGNVVIGAPTASGAATAPPPSGGSGEDES